MLEKNHDCAAVMMSKIAFDHLNSGTAPSSNELIGMLTSIVKIQREWNEKKNWHRMMSKMHPTILHFYEVENPDPSKYFFRYDKNIFGLQHKGLVSIHPIGSARRRLDVKFCRAMNYIRVDWVEALAAALYDYSLTSNILTIQTESTGVDFSISVITTPFSDGQTNIDADLIQKFVDLQKDLKEVF